MQNLTNKYQVTGAQLGGAPRIQENRDNGSSLMGHLGSAAKPVGQGVRPLVRNSAAAVMVHQALLVAGS